DLTVADPADEENYLPALENLGFELIVREPRFHGHHLFHLEKPRVNLHVFGPDCPKTVRHLLFRDWLRQSEDDCLRYANAKLEAVQGCSVDIAKYHENKKRVVHDIYRNIFQSLGYLDSEDA
ncbi:GrpB family protein, partial [Serratia proteamaculans]|uniref:GrpB family protein n=1 Tax=Serratia proteamaculans TaxID=28151 RepID=UPI0039AF59F1